MIKSNKKILKIINRIRSLNENIMIPLCSEGQCYNFSLLLKELEPSAEIWYSRIEGHIYTKINNYFYDINGIHFKVPDDIELLDHRYGDKPHRWGKRDIRKLCY